MTVAFLFPGQGAPLPPGRAWEGITATAALLDLGSAAAGVDLFEALERGGARLDSTAALQPALTALALGCAAALRARGVEPTATAGHSVGELAAWAASGAITPEDAVRATALRGRLMAREAASHPGGMAAVRGDAAAARRLVEESAGTLSFAAENTPDESVLSGDGAALAALERRIPAQRLAVSGAWHSPAMAAAVEELAAALRALPRQPPSTPLYANSDGEPYGRDDDVPARLAAQLVRPVMWRATLLALARDGIHDFVLLGAGRTLRAHARANLGAAARLHLVETAEDVDRAARELG